MASGKKETMRTKAELLAELAVSRQALGADLPEVYCRLNPVARVQRSFSRNPTAWFAASAVVGLIGSKYLLSSPSKKRSESSKKSRKALLSSFPALGWLVKSAWIMARPEAEKLLREQISAFLSPNTPSAPGEGSKDSA